MAEVVKKVRKPRAKKVIPPALGVTHVPLTERIDELVHSEEFEKEWQELLEHRNKEKEKMAKQEKEKKPRKKKVTIQESKPVLEFYHCETCAQKVYKRPTEYLNICLEERPLADSDYPELK